MSRSSINLVERKTRDLTAIELVELLGMLVPCECGEKEYRLFMASRNEIRILKDEVTYATIYPKDKPYVHMNKDGKDFDILIED